METPESLRAQALRARQNAERLTRRAQWEAEFAATLEERARRLEQTEAGTGALHVPDEHATLNAMDATKIDTSALKSRAKVAYPENRFVIAMGEDGDTIKRVADFLTAKLGRPFHKNTVQGWYVPVSEGTHRDIPRDAAEALRDRYGKRDGAWRVPTASWPRIRG